MGSGWIFARILALLFENELSLDCVQQSYPEAFTYAKMLHFNDCLMSKKIVAFVLQWLGEERVGYKPRLCVINSLLKKQTQEIARSIQEVNFEFHINFIFLKIFLEKL